MKKVVLSLAFVALLSVSFVSCKQKESEAEEPAATEVAPAEEPAPAMESDTTAAPAMDTTATPAEKAPSAE